MDELVNMPNPFGDGIVKDPWTFDDRHTPDVAAIHRNRYELCLHFLNQDVRQRASTSVLITGAFGSGKTHLVARLFKHFRSVESSVIPCYVSMHGVDQHGLWTHLRRQFIRDLFRRVREKVDNLSRLLATRMPEFASSIASPEGLVERVAAIFWGSRNPLPNLIDEHLSDVPRILRTALRLAYGDNPTDRQFAREWLQGDWLPTEQTQRLGFPSSDITDKAKERESRDLVLSLVKLSNSQLPLVICIDQVEPLQHTLNDLEGFRQLSQLAADLRNSGYGRFLLLFFIASSCRDQFMHASNEADWDRIRENEVTLNPLTEQEALQLFIYRLEATSKLKELRVGKSNRFWPFDESAFKRLFSSLQADRTPRTFLAKAKAAFSSLVAIEPVPDETLPKHDDRLLCRWRESQKAKRGLPNSELFTLLLNSLPWLAQILGTAYRRLDSAIMRQELPDVPLILETPQGSRTAFAPCPKATNTWQRFDRVSNRWRHHRAQPQHCERLVVLCDAGRGDFLFATQQRYDLLLALDGAVIIQPNREHLVAMNALHTLFLDAAAGEIVHEGTTINPEAVHKWACETVQRGDTELGCLRELFDDLGLELTLTHPVGSRKSAPIRTEPMARG